ncbi:unnamed protein product [Rotaria magnacalcarata]
MDVNVTTVQNILLVQSQIKKKKCHGNREDQRFRRKCRAKGMKSRKIEKLLLRRKLIHHKKKNPADNKMKNTMKFNNKSDHENVSSTEINLMRNLTKRKRDISLQDIKSNTRISKSTSSISVAQPKLKKMKRRINLNIPTTTTITNNTAYKYYRQPIYLKRSPMILIQMLTNIINYNLKKKEEKIFLCHRLDLLDKHYYLQVHQQLWQSYSDIGIQQHRWPDQLYTMAKTNDFQICQKYLDKYINTIKKEIDTCHIQLNNQKQSYPLTTLSLDQLEHYLKAFVDCQRKYLSMRNNKQLQKFIDNFHEKQLFETISTLGMQR